MDADDSPAAAIAEARAAVKQPPDKDLKSGARSAQAPCSRPSASVEISPCLLLRQIHLVGPADRFGALPIGLGVGGQQAASLAKPISSRPAEGLESTRMVPFRRFARAL